VQRQHLGGLVAHLDVDLDVRSEHATRACVLGQP
jgi:hypothetical protein